MNKKLVIGGGLGVLGAAATFAGLVLTQGFSVEALVAAVIGGAGAATVIVKALKKGGS